MAHVSLGAYAPSTAPIQRSTQLGANVVANTVPYTPFGTMGLAPEVPTAEMGHKAGGSCHRHRMGKRGTRCFCNGKMVKSGRCGK